MLHMSASSSSAQTVLLLRLSTRPAQAAEYKEALSRHGLDLIECVTPEAARSMARAGCKVGLLVVTQESDLAHLDRCEPAVCNSSICWVALVSENLIGRPRMREFIAEHLFNFITLPAELDHIVLTLRHAWGMAFMRELRNPPPPPAPDDGECALLGSTAHMEQLRAQIQKIARTDAPVLICGPSGSGKELAARMIHRQSARADGTFVSINCGTIGTQRFEAALFGTSCGEGSANTARGGTLFLGAVGELSAQGQACLLHFLGERGERPAVDLRVMAASRSSLVDAVRAGRFRDDLYYRLNVMSLETPGLADRGPDIEAIARYYFARFSRAHNRSLRGFSKAAMNAMLSHSWPGNVRELVNRVQRATAMAEGRFIQPEDLGLERPQDTQLLSLEEARAAAERAMIHRALAQSRNQISRAAALLGISRVTLYRLLEKYNIRPESSMLVRPSMLSVRPQDNQTQR